jgi:hypothetical protein
MSTSTNRRAHALIPQLQGGRSRKLGLCCVNAQYNYCSCYTQSSFGGARKMRGLDDALRIKLLDLPFSGAVG